MTYNLDQAIRKIPDFPKAGVLFYDITGILNNPEAFDYVQKQLDEKYAGQGITAVAAIESRGFIFAAPFAHRHGIPLILIRKKGKLPGKTLEKRYALEYGEGILEVQPSDVPPQSRILLIDDLLATGGTINAAADLLEEAGGLVKGLFCIVGLPFLHPEKVLQSRQVDTLINYSGE